MKTLTRWWNTVSQIGIKRNLSAREQHRGVFINRTNAVIGLLSALFLIVYFIVAPQRIHFPLHWVFSVFAALLSLFLNSRQRFGFTQLWLAFYPVSLFVAFPLLLPDLPSEYLLLAPVSGILFSVLPHLLFDSKIERKKYLFFIAYHGVLIFSLFYPAAAKLSGKAIMIAIDSYLIIYQVFIVTVWAMLMVLVWRQNVAYYAQLQQNDQLQKRSKATDSEIDSLQEQIAVQKELLDSGTAIISEAEVYNLHAMKVFQDTQKLSVFPSHFVLHRKKDALPRDFYWIQQHKQRVYMLVADCSREGFASNALGMLSVHILNACLLDSPEAPQAGQVLNYLREALKPVFAGIQAEYESLNTLDACVCVIAPDTRTLEFSGAYLPLYLIRNHTIDDQDTLFTENRLTTSGDATIVEIKPDSQPIGAYRSDKDFTTHSYRLKQGDQLYMLTDGYIDQSNHEKNSKFTKRQFKQLLLTIHNKPMAKQHEILTTTIDKWMGRTERQLDDFLILATQIG